MALCEHKPYYIDGINMKCSINVPSKFKVFENKNPCKLLTYRDLFWRVPGGTRTHDIQNHKQVV